MDEAIKVKFTGDASSIEAASHKTVSSLEDVAKASTKVSQTLSQSSAQMARQAAVMGGAVKKGSNEATQSLINLSRVAQDAPYGFLGIANNLNPLLESFQRLKASTGTTGGALKALGSSLMGAGGIGLALGVVSSLLVVFGDKLFGAGKAASAHKQKIDDLKASFDKLKDTTSSDILGGAGSEFSKAVSAIETLKENVDLAKKGFIDKKEVVNQYNKELGDTIGKVKTLGEVEQAIAQKGEAYLKFTLLKAAAQQALSKASEAAIVAAENQAKANEISQNAFVKGTQQFLNQQGNFAGAFKLQQNVNTATQGFRKAVNEADKEKGRFINIFKDFQEQAAEIAKTNKFKFNPDIKVETPKTKADKSKFDFLFDFLPFDPSGKLKPEQRSDLLKAIDSFSKDFQGILKGVDFSRQAKTEDEKIKLALKFDADLKAGKVNLDTRALTDAIHKSIKTTDLLPPDLLPELNGADVVKMFVRGLDPVKIDLGNLIQFDTPEKALAELRKQLNRVGEKLPATFEATNIFGQKVEVTLEDLLDFTKITPEEAVRVIKNAIKAVANAADDFGDIGNKIGERLGHGFGDVFEKIFKASLNDAVSRGLSGDALENFKDGLTVVASITTEAFSGLGDAFGNLTSALLRGKNGMESFGESLKNTFTQLAAQLAKTIVLAGILSLITGGIGAKGGLSFIGAFKKILGFAKGGPVPGSGSGDTVPAMLTPGEYVVTKDKAPLVIEFLKSLGHSVKMPKISNGVMGFAQGGLVTARTIDNSSNSALGRIEQVPYIAGFDISHDKVRLMLQRANQYGNNFGR